MSQFEFMRNLPVGQYLPLDSFIHRMDPRARLTSAVMILLALTFANGLIGLGIGFAFILIALILARISPGYALQGLKTPLPFIIILALLQIIWNGGADAGPILAAWSGITITLDDFKFGGALLIRFAGLVLGLGLISYTTSTSQLTQGLNGMLKPFKLLRIQVDDFVMMVQITLRFLPLLAQTAERIAKAQASRGADWDNRKGNLLARVQRVVPIILPLFIISLNRAGNLALAMDARGYGSGFRTSQAELRTAWLDWATILASGVVTVLILSI